MCEKEAMYTEMLGSVNGSELLRTEQTEQGHTHIHTRVNYAFTLPKSKHALTCAAT